MRVRREYERNTHVVSKRRLVVACSQAPGVHEFEYVEEGNGRLRARECADAVRFTAVYMAVYFSTHMR